MDSAPGALEIVQIGWTHASKDWWKLPLEWKDLTDISSGPEKQICYGIENGFGYKVITFKFTNT
ncbi:hypothetical protein EYZ11_002942 [Aspergillus tanneri]|uniref:Uncharacterized protein n=1 Tax=Aspergillus tanneri TaxID=1220188 RepID=A0A4S3JRQ6_9EURO|nr:hypothetical protein EYZ11_002942 [Aspergillus tanneri]